MESNFLIAFSQFGSLLGECIFILFPSPGRQLTKFSTNLDYAEYRDERGLLLTVSRVELQLEMDNFLFIIKFVHICLSLSLSLSCPLWAPLLAPVDRWKGQGSFVTTRVLKLRREWWIILHNMVL